MLAFDWSMTCAYKTHDPACSHVTSQGSLRCYVCQTNHIKALCIPHGEGRTEFLKKKYEKRPYKYKKTKVQKKISPYTWSKCTHSFI